MDLQHLLTNKGWFHTDTCMNIYVHTHTMNHGYGKSLQNY